MLTPRELDLDALIIRSGGHSGPDAGFCVMEAAAYIAGEPWTDEPKCVCPLISGFMRRWNDSIRDDETRTRLLKPLIPVVLNTVSTPEVFLRRSEIVIDWLVRVFTPKFLDLAPALASHAAALRELPEVTVKTFPDCVPVIQAARAAARDAAGAAAWAAARAAAWDAARDAAWAAAGDALKPTVEELQQSASDLVRRLCSTTEAGQ